MVSTELANIVIGPRGPRFPRVGYEDREEIFAILSAYGRLYDDNQMDAFLELITDEAVFYPNWPGMAPDVVRGKSALAQFFGSSREHAIRNNVLPHHYATNMIITRADEDTAQATVSMLYVESIDGKPEVKMAGQYDYAFIKREGRWYIDQWSMRYAQ